MSRTLRGEIWGLSFAVPHSARGREAKLQNSSGRPPGQMIWTTDFRNKYKGMHSSLCNGFFTYPII